MAVTGSSRDEYVQKRRGRYLAQILDHFEKHIEPHLGPEAGADVQDFKGLVRARMNALAVDCTDLMKLGDEALEQNGVAQDLRDRIDPTGRP